MPEERQAKIIFSRTPGGVSVFVVGRAQDFCLCTQRPGGLEIIGTRPSPVMKGASFRVGSM